jgi:hypothetical protein
MRKLMGVSLALLVGCVTGAGVRELVVPARAQGQTGPSYEFDVVETTNSQEDDKRDLTRYGKEGWRLVAVLPYGSYHRLYLERQK